jgi:hypothetical protein
MRQSGAILVDVRHVSTTKLRPRPNEVRKSAGMMCPTYDEPNVSVESQNDLPPEITSNRFKGR